MQLGRAVLAGEEREQPNVTRRWLLEQVFHTAINAVICRRARALQQRREHPTSRNYSSDSEMQVNIANQPHRKLSVATSAIVEPLTVVRFRGVQ